MARYTFQCFSCGETVESDAVFRTDRCSRCEADVKVCRNCRHYDASTSNSCRETSADYVHDKERANYCDYFDPRQDRIEVASEVEDARAKLEALFKK